MLTETLAVGGSRKRLELDLAARRGDTMHGVITTSRFT